MFISKLKKKNYSRYDICVKFELSNNGTGFNYIVLMCVYAYGYFGQNVQTGVDATKSSYRHCRARREVTTKRVDVR